MTNYLLLQKSLHRQIYKCDRAWNFDPDHRLSYYWDYRMKFALPAITHRRQQRIIYTWQSVMYWETLSSYLHPLVPAFHPHRSPIPPSSFFHTHQDPWCLCFPETQIQRQKLIFSLHQAVSSKTPQTVLIPSAEIKILTDIFHPRRTGSSAHNENRHRDAPCAFHFHGSWNNEPKNMTKTFSLNCHFVVTIIIFFIRSYFLMTWYCF